MSASETSPDLVTIALLHDWYGLIKEKRPLRKDFLRHLTRALDFDVAATGAQSHCSEVRFVPRHRTQLPRDLS